MANPSKKLRRITAPLSLTLLTFLAIYWFKFAPPPLVGGSQPDSWAATRLKSQIYAAIPPEEDAEFTRLTPENAGGWYAITREPIQSIEYYQSQNPVHPTAVRRTLVIQPLGPFTAEQRQLLETLRDYCSRYFQLPVRIAAPLQLPVHPPGLRPKSNKNPSWCAGDGQYNAGQILDNVLLPKLPPDALAVLGVTMADLYAGDMSFVFGLGGQFDRVGVYSLARYFPEFAGHRSHPADKILALRRACQVLNHETGHMLGIYHCVLYKCSMNGSNSLIDADAAPLEYCPVCRRKLLWNTGANATKRFHALADFYQNHGLKTDAAQMNKLTFASHS